ncbi:MAG: helix-hairpin-helix domain-containing protein [Gemmatimonadaceae bacterium]|nr:helix-hairpin-helix domain-containing protein [Gemmatimonadaceae bacterium]
MRADRSSVTRFEQIPNVGRATAGDFETLGLSSPAALVGMDPLALYDRLCHVTGQRHDPCCIDVFIAAVRYMEGGPSTPWWHYTAERKAQVAARAAHRGRATE